MGGCDGGALVPSRMTSERAPVDTVDGPAVQAVNCEVLHRSCPSDVSYPSPLAATYYYPLVFAATHPSLQVGHDMAVAYSHTPVLQLQYDWEMSL